MENLSQMNGGHNRLQFTVLYKNSGLFPYKKQWAEYLEIPGIRPLLSSNLRADFRPVAESKRHPSIRIHCCTIHKSVKQLLTEIH